MSEQARAESIRAWLRDMHKQKGRNACYREIHASSPSGFVKAARICLACPFVGQVKGSPLAVFFTCSSPFQSCRALEGVDG